MNIQQGDANLWLHRCFKCGSKNHASGNSLKCFNCNGSHHAFARECIFYKYYQEALTRSRRYGITIREATDDMKEEGMQLPRRTFADTLKQQSQVASNESLARSNRRKSHHSLTGKNAMKAANAVETSNVYTILSDLEDREDSDYEDTKEEMDDSQSNNTSRDLAKVVLYEQKGGQEDNDDIEKILQELDGTSEVTKRPRTPSETSLPLKDSNEHSPSSKIPKTSSEETVIFPTHSKKSLDTSPSSVTLQKTLKADIKLKPHKSLIRDFPMPPDDNTGARKKSKVNKSINTGTNRNKLNTAKKIGHSNTIIKDSNIKSYKLSAVNKADGQQTKTKN